MAIGMLRAANAGFDAVGRLGAVGEIPPVHLGTWAGGAAGAAYGAVDPDTNAAASAGIGAAAGTAAPPLAGMAGAAAVGAGTGIGRGAIGNIDTIGQGMMNAAGATGRMGAGALFGAQIQGGGAMGRAAGRVLNPVGRWAGALGRMGDRMTDVDFGRSMRIGRKGNISTTGITRMPNRLTGFGKGLFIGGALIGGAREAWGGIAASRRGEMDRQITTATPRMPLEQEQGMPGGAHHAGATGDLVFAMNANRRG